MKQCKLNISSFTEKGLRSRNEDRYSSLSIGENSHLMLVADGMGGYDDGDLAAEIAIETINTCLQDQDNQEIIERIEYAFFKAHSSINRSLNNAGATVGGVLVTEHKIYVFWVGDIKIVVQNGELLFISKEHTLINLLKEAQITIKPEEINRLTHTVIRSLGGRSNSYSPEISVFERSGTLFGVVCSDGLLQHSSEDQLVKMCYDFMANNTIISSDLLLTAKDNVTGIFFSEA